MTYSVRGETPPVEVYQRLRTAAGLSPKSTAAAAAGLAGSWYAVVAYHDDHPVGMSRVIGDGGTAFQIVDMCVVPEHQGRGPGKQQGEDANEDLQDRPADVAEELDPDMEPVITA